MSDLVKRLEDCAANLRSALPSDRTTTARLLDEAIAALSKADMVMVPREPTPEMIEAFLNKAIKSDDYSYGLKMADPVAGYRAMIAASPVPSQQKGKADE